MGIIENQLKIRKQLKEDITAVLATSEDWGPFPVFEVCELVTFRDFGIPLVFVSDLRLFDIDTILRGLYSFEKFDESARRIIYDLELKVHHIINEKDDGGKSCIFDYLRSDRTLLVGAAEKFRSSIKDECQFLIQTWESVKRKVCNSQLK